MISNKVAEALLKQVDMEFFSERQYIAMEYYFNSLDLKHYAKLFHEYALEERRHAYRILAFLDDYNCSTEIGAIKAVQTAFKSPRDVFEAAHKHEIVITNSILEVYRLAEKEGDIQSMQFLDWFVEEQREEEDKMLTRLNRLKLAGDNMAAILFLEDEDGLE